MTADTERPPSCRPTLVAGTGGERPLIGTINSDDGKQAASLQDPLSSLDPLLPDGSPDCSLYSSHSPD